MCYMMCGSRDTGVLAAVCVSDYGWAERCWDRLRLEVERCTVLVGLKVKVLCVVMGTGGRRELY
jgi:hypothetical protein